MNLERLQRDLLALRLVEPGQLREITARIVSPTADDVLAALEASDVLTPFITGKLRKGETDGLVLGGYKLMYRNASGSFARVYRAQSLVDGSMVGLKVLRQRWAEQPSSVDQFHREAELGRRLRHPNIAPIHEIGVDGAYHWFSMEFVEGGNLREFIRIRGVVQPAEAMRYVLDMARGLEYALGMGFTHRDLKMTNVLISSAGVVKLIDFGLAGQGGGAAASEQGRAIEYAAIEKAAHAPANDPRSDLFFLGSILYELLSGEPPYPRTRDREARANVGRYRNVRPIRQIVPNLPARVVETVERLMQLDPGRRYQRPADVVEVAESILRELSGDDWLAGPLSGPASGTAPAPAGSDHGGPVASRSPSAPAQTSVLCVEHRGRHLGKLREYFTKHGLRFLAIGDVNRALDRLDRNPPTCIVLMGGAIGEEIVEAFRTAVERAKHSGTAVVAVLSESQTALQAQMTSTEAHPVLARVATLRDLRGAIEKAIAAGNGRS